MDISFEQIESAAGRLGCKVEVVGHAPGFKFRTDYFYQGQTVLVKEADREIAKYTVGTSGDKAKARFKNISGSRFNGILKWARQATF